MRDVGRRSSPISPSAERTDADRAVDYTERTGVEKTLALGRVDAARYRDQLQSWLARPQPTAAI
jgi:hypothetical protein